MKKIKILHSNDIHADFFSNAHSNASIVELDAALKELKDENSLYFISGDVLNGSIIDKEFKGISTIELLNIIAPDLMCVGNHEFDYGSTWPLLLEKVANFPLICSNVYITGTAKRLFTPYKLLYCNGLTIAVIGLLTSTTNTKIQQQKNDHLIEVREDYHHEVQTVIQELQDKDIDLTICLTHLGYEEDIKLAKLLDKHCGIDIIIGGHSHTHMQEPVKHNNILVVQAGTGADQLGCFELVINEDTNEIADYQWTLIDTIEYSSDNSHLQQKLLEYKSKVEVKFSKVITTLPTPLENKDRTVQTTANTFIANLLSRQIDTEIAFVHGGFTRKEFIEPFITLETFHEAWPFTDALYLISLEATELSRLLTINFENLGTNYFCCTSTNAKITICDDQSIDISINNKPLSLSQTYHCIFSEYILSIFTENQFLTDKNILNKKLLTHNTNKFLLDILEKD